MRTHLFFSAVIGAVVLSACTTTTGFIKTPDEQLVIGKTSEAEIRQLRGKPYQQSAGTKNDKPIKTLSYAYASTGGEANALDVTAAKSQNFYIFQDKLAGHEFVSSWKEDSTDFDETKIAKIQKDVTTRSEVIKIMGPPSGKYGYPLIPGREDEALVYAYNHVKGAAGNLKRYNKLLVVSFNKQGIVSNVEYTSSGEK